LKRERDGSPRSMRTVATAVLWGAVALTLLAPLWLFSHFPSQDGPSHVYNARLALLLLWEPSEVLRAFFEWNLDLFPNWFSQASLAALLTLLPPLWAERLLLTAYALSVPLSFRYALVAVRPAAAPVAWLSVPFVLNRYIHEGFYNRAFALVPFFLALGYYVRRRGVLALRPAGVLGLIVLWLYFCAGGSFLLLAVLLAVLAVAFALQDAAAGLPRWKAGRARLPGLVALAPALALFLRFEIQQHPERTGVPPGFLERARYLFGLYDLVIFDMREAWIAAALALLLGAALVLAALARRKEGGWRAEDALLVTALVYTALYFAAPRVSVPGVRSEPTHLRLSLHVILAFVLWIAQALRGRAARLVLAGALAGGLALTAVRLPYYARLDTLAEDQFSLAPSVPRGATFLPLSFDNEGDGGSRRPLPEDWIIGPLRHAADRIATERDLVSMDNYQADTPWFPLQFRAGANAHELLQSRLDSPGCVRIARLNRLAPRPVDFVLLWRRDLAPADACTRATLRAVDAAYRRVGASPRGYAELLERRKE
jgi:hypothetical protein